MHGVARTIFVAAVAVASAACDRGSSSNDDPAARPLVAAFNAVPDMRTITFLREEEVWTALEYGSATGFRDVGADQYDLNFDTVLPGDKTTSCNGRDADDVKDDDECTRLASQSINVIADHEYVVALLGRWGNLRVQVYDKLVHTFDTPARTATPTTKRPRCSSSIGPTTCRRSTSTSRAPARTCRPSTRGPR